MNQPASSTSVTSVTPVAPTVQEVLNSLVTKVGNKDDEFPMLDRVWDIYAGKGIRTVFLTVGSSSSAIADLSIAESLGCPLNIVTLSDKEKESWAEVSGILKERKRDATASSFSEGTETKWILPKNVRVSDSVPWWSNGTVDISGTVLKTQSVNDFVSSIAATMKLKDNATRIDILKVDTAASAPGLERAIIGAVLSAGYRPAVLLVRWSKMPDVDLSTTIAAGHLQNCGYSLYGKIDNKFLYYFSDEDMYQICSWENVGLNNPITTEIISASKTPTVYEASKCYSK